MDAASHQQPANHEEHRVSFSDRAGASGKEDRAGSRADEGLHRIVGVIHSGDFIRDGFNQAEHDEHADGPPAGQGIPRRSEVDEVGKFRQQ